MKFAMDPYTLSKLGNVSIQRLPAKSDVTDSENKERAVKQSFPVSTTQLQFLKLPPSINITVTSTNATSDLVHQENQTKTDEPKNTEETDKEIDSKDFSSDHSEKTEPEPPNKSSTNGPEESHYFKTKIPDAEDEIENNFSAQTIESTNTVDNLQISNKLVQKVDSSNLAEDEISESMKVLETLPEIKKEPDDSEFREVDEHGNLEFPDTPLGELIATELPEEMIACKEEKLSDNEDSESDDADDENDDNEDNQQDGNITAKKKKRKTKIEGESKESKKQKTQDDETNSDSEEKEKEMTSEVKVGNLRRNIREVMDETKLDEATLAAQMQEKERLRRVQEQLKANRDIQRQIRVISRFEKGINTTMKKEELDIDEPIPNKVVVTLNTGSSTKHMLDMLKKRNSSSASDEEDASLDKFANLSKHLDKPQMMTSSVSIAPVNKELKKLEVIPPSPKLEEDDSNGIPKGKDIVMISSGSEAEENEEGLEEEEDDDCIVISEEEESEPEDNANSGMHTNDEYNIPDAQGRVLVNVGHSESEQDVFLAPQIARIIKPHQIGGVRFLFDNIVESLDRYSKSDGFGCILAHSMGLGKTLQVISFSDVFLRYTEGRSILCIMPINTLQNWVAEFNMWLPTDPETSQLKEQGEVLGRQFPVFVLNDNQKTLSARSKVISQWYREGGVLLIGYELYRQLCLKKPGKSRTRSKKESADCEEDVVNEKSKTLLESMYQALVDPGADLVICDEGHRIKNSHASTSQALKQIRSKRRVVLTGYPLQNNLLEYWCMVDFVRPNYLGTKTEFSNMFERPIQNGQCIDSTPEDVKLMRYRAHVLHSLLEGFVQRRSHSVLQKTLPSKYEFVLLFHLTPFQQQLYTTFMNDVVRTKAVPNPLKAFAVCCKIWNHPDILYNFLKKRAGEEDTDLDLEDTTPSISTTISDPSTPVTPSTPSQQLASKRSRNRTPKGSQNKDAKVARKNSRTNTPQPINKPPSMAAIPPNTASNPEPLPPEQAITTSNNQSIPTFNSYNNNKQNYRQPSNETRNAEYNHQSSNSNHNFNNSQYNQQRDYNESSLANNTDYSNVTYQQNFGAEGTNNYQSEYPQNNYWSRNNESNSNFYNSPTPSSEDFYQNTSQSSQSYSSSEYSNSSSEQSRGAFNSQNYNFDMSPQMYSNVANFSLKQEMSGPQEASFGLNENMAGANVMNEHMFGDNTNYSDFRGELNVNPSSQQFGVPATAFQPGRNGSAVFDNSFHTPLVRAKRPGRPPLSQQRARVVGMNPRCGVAGKKRDTNMPESNLAIFKPGLPGGAPILKADEQNFNPQSTHLLCDELNASGNNFSNPMNPSFLDSINNDELWNPGASQSSIFPDQNYMYNSHHGQNQPFVSNNTSGLLDGVISNIQSNEIFNPPQQAGFSQSTNEQNLYIDNYSTYLNDIQMPAATSFMGLLQGDDSLDLHQSEAVASMAAQMNVETSMNSSSLPVQKNVSQSIQGLAHSGQITLPPINNNKSDEGANIMGCASAQNTEYQSFPKTKQTLSRLPSIDVFNTNQDFAENNNANNGNLTITNSYNYDKGNTNSYNQSSQINWSGFNVNENSPNFNYAAVGSQLTHPINKKLDQLTPENENRLPVSFDTDLSIKQENYAQTATKNVSHDNASKDDSLNRFATNQNISLINVSDQMKISEKKAVEQCEPDLDNASVARMINERRAQPVRHSPIPGTATPNTPFQKNSENQTEIQHSSNVQRAAATFTKPMVHSGNVYRTDSAISKDVINTEPKLEAKMPVPETATVVKGGVKDVEPGIPYEWANEFFKDYEPGKLEASAKTLIFFSMLDEIIKLGDRILLFSQSLFTLDLIEDFLHLYNIPNTEEKWARNKSYFRLDGSTSALEREKLINEFNANPNIHLFLVSTRAGSLGINLVGANRVVVFDASWNPCHDTQAVCRVYRYGQQKCCYVYRFVMDNCLEKKIYDRQINKQGMSDRIVDECNPDAHLTTKDVSNLCWDTDEVSDSKSDFKDCIDKFDDSIIKKVIEKFGSSLSKEPFIHESLLVDRKDTKLSQAEKRMAKRGYELEKQASSKPTYSNIQVSPQSIPNRLSKPMASVRPMVADNSSREPAIRRWIPAEVWQKQGMSAQEMTLPLDVVIPTNTTDSRSSIVLKAGQKVMVLKSPKGIYMQLENGKIVAIKTSLKSGLNTGNGKLVGAMPRLSSLSSHQGGGVNVGPGVKVMARPGLIDRSTLAALASRRDIVSSIRNRFPRPTMSGHMTQTNLVQAGPQGVHRIFRQRSLLRPGQPVARHFPLPRPQGNRIMAPQSTPLQRPHSQLPSLGPSQAASASTGAKQIFGPNSSVTISVANKIKAESQVQQQQQQQQIMGATTAATTTAAARSKEAGKDATSHLTEVSYDDYNNIQRAGDHPRSSSTSQYSDFPLNNLQPSRNVQFSGRPDAHTGSRDSRTTVPESSIIPKLEPGLSKVIPESFRFKKGINLTPVMKTAPAVKLEPCDERKMIPYHHHHHQQQQHQHHHQQEQQQQQHHHHHHQQPFQQVSRLVATSNPPKPAVVVQRPAPKVQPKNASLQLKSEPSTSGVKKELTIPAPPLQNRVGDAHSISIFPVIKKEEGTRNEDAYEQEYQHRQQQQQQPSKHSYFPGYANKSQPQQQPPPHQQPSYQFYENADQYYSAGFSQQSAPGFQQTSQPFAPYSNSDCIGSYSEDGTRHANAGFNTTAATSSSATPEYDYDSFYKYNQQPVRSEGIQPLGQPPPQ